MLDRVVTDNDCYLSTGKNTTSLVTTLPSTVKSYTSLSEQLYHLQLLHLLNFTFIKTFQGFFSLLSDFFFLDLSVQFCYKNSKIPIFIIFLF